MGGEGGSSPVVSRCAQRETTGEDPPSPPPPLSSDERRGSDETLGEEYARLIEEYDRTGLPLERALARLGYTAWLLEGGEVARGREVNAVTLGITAAFGLRVLRRDALAVEAPFACDAAEEGRRLEVETGIRGPLRR